MPRLTPLARSPHRPATPLTALRLALVLAAVPACGSGDDLAGPGDEDDGGAAAGRLPAALVGTWRIETAGDVYCDPGTGQCVVSFAQSETLALAADGGFERSLYAESNFPPCSMVVHHVSEGRARVEGRTLELRIEAGTTRVQDSCGESSTTDESGAADRYDWEMAEGAGGPELVLINADGTRLGPYTR